MSERIFNFSAGPAILPLEVLEIVRENILNFEGCGMGVMELSHRGKEFEGIIQGAESTLRRLLSISDDYAVCFTTGGATQQASMIPMNLLGADQVGDYLVTGAWAKKALGEAKKFGEVRAAASSESEGFRSIPAEFELSAKSAYLHFTSNNTIFGTQFTTEPDSGNAPLICDASSDFLCRDLDVSKYGLIYAGAQKNIGPAGVTVVVIRKDLLERIPDGLPVMLDYRTYSEKASLFNTPPSFPIYVVGEVLKWIERHDGLSALHERNKQKAAILYEYLDSSSFYTPFARTEDRSLMNVTFRLADESLEGTFIAEADAQGLKGLKGHRSVGGIRASIYNAFPSEGVTALVAFMKEFETARA